MLSVDADCSDSGETLASEPDGDCDDADKLTYPKAFEIIGDNKDQSCDGSERCYTDEDADGLRIDTTVLSDDTRCDGVGEAASAAPSDDCDDGSDSVYPGAEEVIADDIDQDCDGADVEPQTCGCSVSSGPMTGLFALPLPLLLLGLIRRRR
ncbi:MAG: MYXO-CTERM domain-containing protein [Kiritimatiellia bacterium]